MAASGIREGTGLSKQKPVEKRVPCSKSKVTPISQMIAHFTKCIFNNNKKV